MVGAPAFMRGKERFSAPKKVSTLIMRFSAISEEMLRFLFISSDKVVRVTPDADAAAPKRLRNFLTLLGLHCRLDCGTDQVKWD